VRPHYQSALEVELKADRSPVTVADRGAERLIREAIARRFPTHAIVGEEFGDDRRDASHRWFVDPIDGTRSFVHGVPLFGVLLGLQVDGEMLVGVCHLPALGDTIAAARGCGCTWNGRAAHVTKTFTLTEATIVYSDSRLLARRLGAGWDALQQASLLQRGWGDCYGHCLVATGRADVMLDPVMNPWDCAALVPILQESGGRFTDWQGRPRIDGGDAVSTNGHLHDDVLRALAGAIT
jgi:histidinol phosphatase-like enzyme (inositol monophosphatase family)